MKRIAWTARNNFTPWPLLRMRPRKGNRGALFARIQQVQRPEKTGVARSEEAMTVPRLLGDTQPINRQQNT